MDSEKLSSNSDRYGRRLTLIGCLAWASLMTLFVAASPNLEILIGLRFLAGLALGGLLPTALACMSEVSAAGRGRHRGSCRPSCRRRPAPRTWPRAARAGPGVTAEGLSALVSRRTSLG